MSLINKISNVVSKEPVFRLGGWQTMGAHTKAPDTRTTEQLLANIEYFAQKNPEVAKFKSDLKAMNPKYLGLVSDICELTNRSNMLNTNINLKDPKQVGKNVFAAWIEKLPKASKENPEALEFTQEVINQTSSDASKYFLASSTELLDHPEFSEHLKATKPLVKGIAENELSGGYTMDFSKEQRFVNALAGYVNSSSDPAKIKMIPEILSTAENVPGDINIYIEEIPFIQSKVPVDKLKANLQVFPKVAEMLSSQGRNEINMTDFLMKNVNLD